MTALSSLIVARKAATIAEVDEALARQVVRGGDLGTCMLELGLMSEAELVPLLAEAHGFERTEVGELPAALPAVLRLVPRAVALRYGIYPLEEKGGELLVAVAEPLPQAVEDDLGFALGAHLRQLAAPLVRIRQAIARDYGLPLDRRFVRLLAKLEKRPDPSPSDMPPRPEETPKFPGGGVKVSKTGTMIMESAVPPPPTTVDQGPASVPPQRIIAPPVRRNTWPGMFVTKDEGAPSPPVHIPPPAPTPTTPADAAPPESPEPPPAAERKPSAAPPPGFLVEAMAATAAQVEKKRRWRAEHASGKALLGWARRALGNSIPSDQPAQRRRGPFTAAAAELQLEGATTGEQALAIFFAFARQYFEYSALFMVHGDLAAGHDASGPGTAGDKLRAIGVALDLPSALSFAKERGTPTLVQLKRVGLDADLRSDLARPAQHDVLVLPIVMRGRCVAMLYGDDGDRRVEYGEIGDVVAMASLLSAALERVLLRKKRAALRDSSAVKSKRGEAIDRSSIAPAEEKVGAPSDISALAAKRGTWSEEEIVDEGWNVVDGEDKPVRPTPQEGKRSPAPPPPPPEVAAVRPIATTPIAREEADDSPPPELMISEAEDAATMKELLQDLDDKPSPQPSPVRSLDADLVRRTKDPMASTSISAGPHPPPPPSQGPFRNLPSVLIRSDLVDQVIAGGEKAERALGEILALGEAAIPSVFARFPGPLTVDRNQALGELPRPADCGPVLRIVAAMRRLALPFLAVRSGDIDVDVRFWATYLLGELAYADAGIALLPRLFDENPTVRRIAVRSARSLVAAGDEGIPIRKNLERMVGYAGEPLQRRLIALSTIGELKLYKSIPALIEVLSDPVDAIADAAVRALVAMTRQEFGRDPKRWTDWWETKGKKRLA
jgi:hypothetical protein